MSIRTTLKKWGNSFGIVIPKEVTARMGLKENDEVEVTVRKAVEIRTLFKKYRFEDIQHLKDELRAGWG